MNLPAHRIELLTFLELQTGGCLRLYRWDSGGSYKGKAWNSDLPTDAQVRIIIDIQRFSLNRNKSVHSDKDFK